MGEKQFKQCCSGTRSSIPDPVREPDFLDRYWIAIQFEKPWIGTVRIGDSLRIFRTNPITKIEAICLYAFSIIYATTGPQVYTVVSNGGCHYIRLNYIRFGLLLSLISTYPGL